VRGTRAEKQVALYVRGGSWPLRERRKVTDMELGEYVWPARKNRQWDLGKQGEIHGMEFGNDRKTPYLKPGRLQSKKGGGPTSRVELPGRKKCSRWKALVFCKAIRGCKNYRASGGESRERMLKGREQTSKKKKINVNQT